MSPLSWLAISSSWPDSWASSSVFFLFLKLLSPKAKPGSFWPLLEAKFCFFCLMFSCSFSSQSMPSEGKSCLCFFCTLCAFFSFVSFSVCCPLRLPFTLSSFSFSFFFFSLSFSFFFSLSASCSFSFFPPCCFLLYLAARAASEASTDLAFKTSAASAAWAAWQLGGPPSQLGPLVQQGRPAQPGQPWPPWQLGQPPRQRPGQPAPPWQLGQPPWQLGQSGRQEPAPHLAQLGRPFPGSCLGSLPGPRSVRSCLAVGSL